MSKTKVHLKVKLGFTLVVKGFTYRISRYVNITNKERMENLIFFSNRIVFASFPLQFV